MIWGIYRPCIVIVSENASTPPLTVAVCGHNEMPTDTSEEIKKISRSVNAGRRENSA